MHRIGSKNVSSDTRSAVAFCVVFVLLGIAVVWAVHLLLNSVNSDDVLRAVASMQFHPKQTVAELFRH